MKMPDGGSAPVPRLDMLVKPLSRFGERGYLMRLALPDTNHRDNQKYKGGYFEQRPAERTASQRADDAEDRLHYQYRDVECDAL